MDQAKQETKHRESFWGTHGYCWKDELYQLSPADVFKSRCIDAWSQCMSRRTRTLLVRAALQVPPLC